MKSKLYYMVYGIVLFIVILTLNSALRENLPIWIPISLIVAGVIAQLYYDYRRRH